MSDRSTKPDEDISARLPVPSRRQLLIWRLILASLLAAPGVLLIAAGQQAVQNRSVIFAWESHQGWTLPPFGLTSVERRKVQLLGSEAIVHGVGLFASGVTLIFWSVLLVWSLARRQAPEASWRGVHFVATLLSMAGVTTAMIVFFPPWHIPYWPSCDALWVVLLFLFFLACFRDRRRILYFSKFGFPALIVAAILLAQVWIGAFAGTIAGIIFGLVLGAHVISLIPDLRDKAWERGGSGQLTFDQRR